MSVRDMAFDDYRDEIQELKKANKILERMNDIQATMLKEVQKPKKHWIKLLWPNLFDLYVDIPFLKINTCCYYYMHQREELRYWELNIRLWKWETRFHIGIDDARVEELKEEGRI